MDTKLNQMILECNTAEQEIRHFWTRGTDSLDEAALYLSECLGFFGFELDHDPFFATMPHFRDEFDYLWALFIAWGIPEKWDPATHCLGGLSREELCCAFAHSQLGDVRFLLSPKCKTGSELAGKKLNGAKRALAFVGDRMARH